MSRDMPTEELNLEIPENLSQISMDELMEEKTIFIYLS